MAGRRLSRYVVGRLGNGSVLANASVDPDISRGYPTWRRYLADLLGVRLDDGPTRDAQAGQSAESAHYRERVEALLVPALRRIIDALTTARRGLARGGLEYRLAARTELHLPRKPEMEALARAYHAALQLGRDLDVLAEPNAADQERDHANWNLSAQIEAGSGDGVALERARAQARILAEASHEVGVALAADVASRGIPPRPSARLAPPSRRRDIDIVRIRRGLAVRWEVVDINFVRGLLDTVIGDLGYQLLLAIATAVSRFSRELTGDPVIDNLTRIAGSAAIVAQETRRMVGAPEHSRFAESAIVEIADGLAQIGELLDNVEGADLREVDLDSIPLDGIRWSSETKWPPELQSFVERNSAKVRPGLFVIRAKGPRGRDRVAR